MTCRVPQRLCLRRQQDPAPTPGQRGPQPAVAANPTLNTAETQPRACLHPALGHMCTADADVSGEGSPRAFVYQAPFSLSASVFLCIPP